MWEEFLLKIKGVQDFGQVLTFLPIMCLDLTALV